MKRFLFLSLCCLFLWTGLTEAACAETDSAQPQDSIKAWYDKFEEYLGRTDLVTPGELQKLPVGMRNTIGNTNYDLLFTDAVFGADYTELAVYLRISGPDWQGGKRELFFGADKVLISNKGGYIGDVKLALMGDVVFKDKGDRFCLRFLGRSDNGAPSKSADGLPPTYAIVNCKGFQELQISAELSVTDENIVFIDHGERTNEPLRTTFFCNAKSLDDIVVSLSLPEFGLKDIPDWSFAAEKVTLDFSQTRNAPGFEPYKLSGGKKGDTDFSELWQGLYMEGIRLRFPDYIKKVDGARPTVEARKFWIDEHGCTGLFAATDLLRLDEGSLGGWGFSVKEFSFSVERNRLVEGGMKGSVQIPVSTANSYGYTAKFAADGTWEMLLKLDKKASFDFIKAREVELYANSHIKMKKEKDKPFLIEANLSGKMKLNPTAGENDKFGFGNFEFQGLKIRNRAPYFEVNRIEWDDELKVGNFPVSIRDLEIHAKQSDISLGFKTQVHIGDKSDASFGGDLAMDVKSAVEEESAGGKQKWKFKGVDINEVKIDFSNSFLSFVGGVKFIKGDKRYGNGFQGMLDFKIEPLGGLGLRADMMFGSMATYRYWYADVLARLGAAGIPVFPGFKIAAIGGGAYKHMRMEHFSGPLATPGDFGENTDGIGMTSTGLRYVPDSTKSLGLKTAVVLALQDEKVFNAELTFEMLFNKNGGASRFTLTGVGKLMAENNINIANFTQKITDLAAKIQPSVEDQRKAASANASVTANVKLDMDFTNHAFTGLFDVFMDMGVIKGAGSRGHMGTMGMYFGRDNWYIKVGEPAQPLAVQLKVGPLQAKAGAYFMTGSQLPDFPGPSSKLQSLLKTSYPQPDMNELREGAGLAFGSNFHLSTGTIPILIFYAAFDAEVGFDIMMKKYPGTLCQETGSAPGIKGWYAQGQAYTYMMTDVGLYLKLFGQKRNFSILRGEVGALLRAGLPNPASFEGSLGVNVSILNGLVRGKFNLDFNLGQSCTMMQQGFADGADVISSTLPEKGSKNVDVFSVPQAAFNFPVETEIVEEYDRQERRMKINLDQYELWYGGTKLKGKFEYDQDNRVVKFLSHDMLPANATLDFKLAVGAKEKKGASSWTTLKDENGQDYNENRLYSFQTASAPDSIPWSNVQYCYPVKNQEHYLPEETDKGFVFLKRGMADLFSDPDYRMRVVLLSASDSLSVPFTYNQAERRVMWTMPKGLKTSTEYELRLVMEYKGATQASGAQTSALQNATVYASDDGALEQETVTLTASATKSDKDKTVLCYRFKTGLFKDFKSKMEAVSLNKAYRTPIIYMNAEGYAYVNDPDVHYLQANMKARESFCENERQGTLYSGYAPLVQASADLSDEPYYKQDIYPLVYEKYPYNGTVQFERREGREGVIPTWAVYPSVLYREGSTEFFPWIYALPVQYKQDFNAILGSVAHSSLLMQSPYYAWLGKNFKPIRNGSYPVVLRYVLPDGTVTSEVKVNFENK